MRRLLYFFIDNYKLSLVLMFFITFAGYAGLKKVRREARPPVDFARASIVTSYPGSSPEEVEDQITIKIEEEFRGIDGIRDISSISQAGLSTISVRIDMDNVDSEKVSDELQRKLQRVRGLPSDLLEDPIYTKFNAKEIPVVKMALVGPNKNRERDKLADELKSELEDTKGVSGVRLSGYRNREFQILLNAKKLDRYHVGIREVVDAVKKRTKNIPSGFLKTPGDQRLVRVTAQVRSAAEMEDIIVRSNFSGQSIRVKDVAQVRDGMEDPSKTVRINGNPATLLTISKRANADAIRVVAGVNKSLEKFKKEKLKDQYQLIIYDDEAARISDRLNIVITNAITGMVLVLLILLIFLPGYLGVITSLSLPLAVLGSLALMPVLDVTFNTITMLALIISIGMLVDNAVVISENYARIRLKGIDAKEAALKAVHQFWLPLTATVATTIAAFLPMLVTKGIMGQFIKWIPIMVTIALTMSLIEAFFLLPARLQGCIRDLEKYKQKIQSSGKSPWFDGVRTKFENFMRSAVRLRYWVLLGTLVILGSSIVLGMVGNRFQLFPREETEYYFAGFETPITTTLKQTDQLAGELSQKVKNTLGKDTVRYVIANSGVIQTSGNRAASKNGDYVGMLTIAIPRKVARTLNSEGVLKKLRKIKMKEFSKLTFEAARGGPPVGSALQVTFRSRNNEQVADLAKKFMDELRDTNGVVDLEDDQIRGGPEYRIIPDAKAMSRLKLDAQTVGNALRTALQGTVATELSIDGDDFYLRIRYDDEDRATLESLRQTKIMEPSGKRIPLLSIVKIIEEEGPAVRKRYDFKRSITVKSEVQPEKITSVQLNKIARKKVEPLLEQFPAVSAIFGGEDESTKESTSSLFNAMIIALFGIFIIMVFLFRSILRPLLILSCIPLGLVGVSWSFFFHNRPLSFFALIGVVGLAGVVVNAAIVLVSYIEDVKKDNSENLSLNEVLARASSDRLRAVLVTSLTTVGGLFPTAYGIGGYDSILVPLTLALGWGLVSGTILTLIWVPCGYAIIEDVSSLSLRFFKFIIHDLFASKKGYSNEKANSIS